MVSHSPDDSLIDRARPALAAVLAVAVGLGPSLLRIGDIGARTLDLPPAGGSSLRLRVLTLNMSGLRYPPRMAWVSDQSQCARRLVSVGARIRDASPSYDIVGLQELYSAPDLGMLTCDPRPFLGVLDESDNHQGPWHRRLFQPAGARWRLEADGGIGLMTRHSIERSESWRFAASGGPLRAARGVLFARLSISGSALKVDVYVVHLSAGRFQAEQRRRELWEVSRLIGVTSGSSGNPVLILGDFNIDGASHGGPEYGALLELLGRPRDLWREAGATADGYTYDCRRNKLAAVRRCDYQARIDYLLVGTATTIARRWPAVALEEGDVRLVEWTTPGPTTLPVSDHYGVEASLRFGSER